MVTGSGSELNLVARAWSQRLQVSLGPTRARQHRAERAGPDKLAGVLFGRGYFSATYLTRLRSF
jgi:hypothetical protein